VYTPYTDVTPDRFIERKPVASRLTESEYMARAKVSSRQSNKQAMGCGVLLAFCEMVRSGRPDPRVGDV